MDICMYANKNALDKSAFATQTAIQKLWRAPARVEVFTPSWFLGLFILQLQVNSVCSDTSSKYYWFIH